MTIPHLFQRCWFGGPMPEEFVRYGETWREHHPGWQMLEWDETTLPKLENQAVYEQAARIAPHNVGQLKADVARYELIWRFGGVYIDTDFECLQSIEPLIEAVDAFAAWEEDGVWINNAILGAQPGHPFFRRLIDGLADNVRRNWRRRPNVMTGPQYLTRVWREDPMDLAVFASALFYPFGWSELDRSTEPFPEALAKHHWANKRRKT